MMLRAAILLSLLPFSALAQLQVFVLDGSNLTAVGSSLNVGTAAIGDTIQTQFRVQNPGSTDVQLAVSLASDGGFVIQCPPAPYVPPGLESAFCIDFTPTTSGAYSATLSVNTITISLAGSSVPGAAVTLSGATTPLVYGAVVNFGSVVINQSKSQTFILSNSSSSNLTVNSVTVSGAGFSGPTGASFPLQIGPGQKPTFQVTFIPQSGTPYQGTLTVDGRAFSLTGQGLDPPLPSATIAFASNLGASAQQNSITIPLASASQIAGTGTLTLAFQPSVAGVTDDPAIQFLSGPFRKATVTIAPGAKSATIGGESSMAFQTGTTAGTITFTLTLENNSPQQTSLTIPPSPIILDSENAVRQLGSLSVSFSGFDNTYSASQLAFTFYDLTGKALPQGVINVDASTNFQQYFSSTQAGGSFALLVTFPVTGDTTQIGFVTAQIANSLAATTAQQITIEN
jgi:Abnormal spindle-like microcephaly-assoc'd, ASPM-SPD-2-Hydin